MEFCGFKNILNSDNLIFAKCSLCIPRPQKVAYIEYLEKDLFNADYRFCSQVC
jgi:hypothetical protein